MEAKSVSVMLLNGANYATWKIQCRMVLIRDGLWSLVNGTDEAPNKDTHAENYAKFMNRSDKALATIVLAVDPALLYLLGDPTDPVRVWNQLQDQFQKKTWANKLALRRRLNALSLRDGSSMTDHIKSMTEIFSELAVIGAPVEDEDKVVTLLASLPDSYNVLVTALEANATVPQMEVVTERLLHEERKMNDREGGAQGRACGGENAMLAGERGKQHQQRDKRGPQCYGCRDFGHIWRYCPNEDRKPKKDKYRQDKSKFRDKKSGQKHKAHKAEAKWSTDSSSDEPAGLIAEHALSTTCERGDEWIVDSGATCHMCHDRSLYSEYAELEKPVQVSLGDGRKLEALGKGVVTVRAKSSTKKCKKLKLHDVLLVPGLSYNLMSVSKAAEYGKTAVFSESKCDIRDSDGNVVALADRVGCLYRMQCVDVDDTHRASVANSLPEEVLWHQRLGHLSWVRMDKLARESMAKDFTYKPGGNHPFCVACTEGKQTRNSFQTKPEITSKEPLEVVHSDVCGKMGTPSLSGAEYVLTFVDDKTRYSWCYIIKRKSEVFEKFKEWKAMAEKSCKASVKTLRTDNGGEYISSEFEQFLKTNGIRHEYTVPKTPEQNGVAERLNRTLIEKVRCMLSDSGLPQVFWAEALATATYLNNRSPTRPIGGVTPFEAWFGLVPTVGHLK